MTKLKVLQNGIYIFGIFVDNTMYHAAPHLSLVQNCVKLVKPNEQYAIAALDFTPPPARTVCYPSSLAWILVGNALLTGASFSIVNPGLHTTIVLQIILHSHQQL